MKRIALIAAAAAAFTTPALADVDFAIAQFNQDKDSVIERIATPSVDSTASVSTSGQSVLADAYAVLTASDTAYERSRDLSNATLVNGGHSARATEIFAELRAADLENE